MLEQAFIRITDKMSAFTNKNKAAQIKLGTRYDDGDLLLNVFCCVGGYALGGCILKCALM